MQTSLRKNFSGGLVDQQGNNAADTGQQDNQECCPNIQSHMQLQENIQNHNVVQIDAIGNVVLQAMLSQEIPQCQDEKRQQSGGGYFL